MNKLLIVIIGLALVLAAGCPKNVNPEAHVNRESPAPALAPPPAPAKPSGVPLKTYRDRANSFSVELPADWRDVNVAGASGLKFIKDDKGNAIIISVQETGMGEFLDVDNLPESEIYNMVDMAAGQIKSIYPDTEVISRGVRSLGGKKAGYANLRSESEYMGIRMPVLLMTYVTYHKGKMVSITAGSKESEFKRYAGQFEYYVSTFRFDD